MNYMTHPNMGLSDQAEVKTETYYGIYLDGVSVLEAFSKEDAYKKLHNHISKMYKPWNYSEMHIKDVATGEVVYEYQIDLEWLDE